MKDTQLATQRAAFEQLQATLKSQEVQMQELNKANQKQVMLRVTMLKM